MRLSIVSSLSRLLQKAGPPAPSMPSSSSAVVDSASFYPFHFLALHPLITPHDHIARAIPSDLF